MTAPLSASAPPGRPVLRFEGHGLSAVDVARRARVLAARLQSEGVGAGDRVVSLLANSAAPCILVHACRRLGAVVVPLSPRWSPSELAEPAARVRPRAAVVDAGGDVEAAAVVVRAAGGRRIEVDAWGQGSPPGDADARSAVDPSAGGAAATDDPFAAWPWPPPPEPDTPQAIVYTSGSTGAPKGAVLTWGNHHASWSGSRGRLGHGADDVWLIALPLHHVGGLAIVLRAAWDGASIIVHPRFDADAVARAIAADGVTRLSLVPTQLGPVIEGWIARFGHQPVPPTLRTVLLGGGPLGAAPVAEAVRLGFPLALTYGLTEAASQVATTAPGWTPNQAAAAPPLEGVRVRMAASAEILVAGPTVFAGYWDDAAATAAALDRGWLHTGDLGRMDADGRLAVVGRRDDRIVTGGENVDPMEVEAALDGHPAVGESCVVGVADGRWGQAVVAVIEPARGVQAGAVPDIARLRAWLRGRLADYKRPRRMVVVDGLPRTGAGKVRRGEARRLAQLDLEAADDAGEDVVGQGHQRAADEAQDAR